MENVRSLINKIDKLTSLTSSESVISSFCYVMEMWLHDNYTTLLYMATNGVMNTFQ